MTKEEASAEDPKEVRETTVSEEQSQDPDEIPRQELDYAMIAHLVKKKADMMRIAEQSGINTDAMVREADRQLFDRAMKKREVDKSGKHD